MKRLSVAVAVTLLVMLLMGGTMMVAAEDDLINWALGAPYEYSLPVHESYPDPDGTKLTDGVYATGDYLDPAWVGHRRADSRFITVDLGQLRPVQKITANFLQQWPKGVRYPYLVSVEVSEDGENWKEVGVEFVTPTDMDLTGYFYRKAEFTGFNEMARYVRFFIIVENWVFMDEIEVLGR